VLVWLLAVALLAVPVLGWWAVEDGGDGERPAGEIDTRPTAAVALGDSFASGEAAGDYERRGGAEDPCHRSSVAQIHQAALPGIDRTVNLACSGATTGDVRLGEGGQHGDPPQAEQLRPVAEEYNVELVVVTVGANDLGWSDLVLDCVLGFLPTSPGCQETWAPELPALTEEVSARIEGVVADVRGVLRDAGQSDGDYDLVLQSYASPVAREAPGMNVVDRVEAGCPLPADAMVWANDELMGALARMAGAAAEASGARFLDLSRAFAGHEVCADTSEVWVAGLEADLTVLSAQALGNEDVDMSGLREAWHPNARGHAQLGRCLARFVAGEGRTGSCAADGAGDARVT
jgi:lysophospholipase L1-like esterase